MQEGFSIFFEQEIQNTQHYVCSEEIRDGKSKNPESCWLPEGSCRRSRERRGYEWLTQAPEVPLTLSSSRGPVHLRQLLSCPHTLCAQHTVSLSW